MKVIFNSNGSVQNAASKTKKIIIGALSAAAVAGGLSMTAIASAAPTPGPVAGPGCFGQWRAGSVQVVNNSGQNAGKDYFSQRAGDNSTINAANRAECEAL